MTKEELKLIAKLLDSASHTLENESINSTFYFDDTEENAKLIEKVKQYGIDKHRKFVEEHGDCNVGYYNVDNYFGTTDHKGILSGYDITTSKAIYCPEDELLEYMSNKILSELESHNDNS